MPSKLTLSDKKMKTLGFGAKPFSNPFTTVKSRIIRATENNPALRDRALYTAYIESYEINKLLPQSLAVFVSAMGILAIPSFDIELLSTILSGMGLTLGIGANAMLGVALYRDIRLGVTSRRPTLKHLNSPGRSTGWAELDALSCQATLEIEYSLLRHGMTEQELQAIGALAKSMAEISEPEGTQQFANGMLAVSVKKEISPEALELVSKATAILEKIRAENNGETSEYHNFLDRIMAGALNTGTHESGMDTPAIPALPAPDKHVTLATTLEHMGIPVGRGTR